MPIIIDGWNFIRSSRSDIADDEIDSLESVTHLISYLADFQRNHSDPIIVVLDSTNEFIDVRYKNTPKLAIVASKDADTYIKGYLDRMPESQRKNVRVVSSDNTVYYYAKSSYAIPVKSEEFWSKLRRV